MNKIYIIITVVLLLFISLIGLIYYNNTYLDSEIPKEEEVKEPKLKLGMPLMKSGHSLEDFSFTKYDNAEKILTVSGKKLEIKGQKIGIFRFNPKKVAEIQNPEVVFFNSNEPVSRAIALFGTLDILSNNILLNKGVILKTEDNKSILTADKLMWNMSDKKVIAEGGCILQKENETFRAWQIKSDVELKDFHTLKDNNLNLLKKLTGGSK